MPMTIDEFAKNLALDLRNKSLEISKKVQNGKSDGFHALVDATIASTLMHVADSVLEASIEKISNHTIR